MYAMLRNRLISQSVLVVLALSLASCATSSRKSSDGANSLDGPMTATGTTPKASPREEKAYKDIYSLYSKAAYEAALAKAQAFEKAFPRSVLFSQVQNLAGLSNLLGKRPAQAISNFQRALEDKNLNPAFTQYLRYNLGNAQFEAGQIEDAQKTGANIQSDGMDRENRIKVHYLKSRIFTKRSLPVESARECLLAGRLLLPTTGPDARTAISAVLELNLKEISDSAVLEDLYHNHEDSTLADLPLFRLGEVEMTSGDHTKGQTFLRLLMSRFPESTHYAQAADITRTGSFDPNASTATPINHPTKGNAIGILLPTKGKFAKFGARSLQGIELAFDIFNLDEPDAKVQLVIEDSGEDAETAVRALNKLVAKHHVVAVIGPLLSKGIDQVTQRAQELGVPLLSLARHSGTDSPFAFQAGLTLKLQANEMARYAIQTLGMKRFAIAYPRDKVGEEGMQRFWDAVEAQGGKITGVESYNAGETDFRQVVDRLAGVYYQDARLRELEALTKDRETNQVKKRTRKTEKYFNLPPIVDYDAIFIPEEPKVAGQIIPTFAYRDVDHVSFLGTSAWNSPEFPGRVQGYAEKTYFLDAFFPESNSTLVRKYVERYRATFNQDPTAMDALAYDAARVLYGVLARHDFELSRSDLKDKLLGVKNFSGVTGRISCTEGLFSRDLKILTVKSDKVVEAPSN